MKDLKFIFLLLCFSIGLTKLSVSNNMADDEVIRQIEQMDNSLNKALRLFHIADSLKLADPQQALMYNRKALIFAKNVNSTEALAKINMLMGELYASENNVQPAINYFLISEKLFEQRNDKKALAIIYGNLGKLYYKNNFELDKALLHYNKMLNYSLELNDQKLIATAYHLIGNLFFGLKNYKEAYKYYNKLLQLSREIGDAAGEAKALNNIGEIERLKGNHRKALEYYFQSLDIHRTIHELIRTAINLENIGNCYSSLGKTDEAFRYFKESLQNYRKANDQKNLASLLNSMGNKVLELNIINEAINYFQEAEKIAHSHHYLEPLQNALFGLSLAYEKKGAVDSALYYFKNYNSVKDSVFKLKEQNNLAAIKTQLTSELNNMQYKLQKFDIEMLTKDNKITSLKLNILIASLVIVILTGVLIVIRYRILAKKERQIREKDSELHKAQKELMEMELKSKDNDLMSFALHIIKKNELLKELRNDIKYLSETADPETAMKLKKLSLHVKQMLQIQQDIDLFQEKVSQTYDGFFSNLKQRFPNLTKNEERLCVLLKLNLSSKEIAMINNTSVKAVEMSRYRLRKKCGINSNEVLTDYIRKI